MNIPPVILNASARHTATLVFLHGLGDTGLGWAGALNTIKPDFLKVKYRPASQNQLYLIVVITIEDV